MTPPEASPTVRECDARHDDITRHLDRIEATLAADRAAQLSRDAAIYAKLDKVLERSTEANTRAGIIGVFAAAVVTAMAHIFGALFRP